MSIDKNFMGLDSFVWWFGVVESRQDPLALNRVRVRVYGWHTESLTEIPSENLPWAQVSDGLKPKEADVVLGFFLDGRSGQLPFVLAVVPGFNTTKPDTGTGFHDLRSQETLKYSPKKPVSRTYNKDGSGITITEANVADPTVLESLRHPNSEELDKQSITGITRYQNLDKTVITARKQNLDKDVVTAGGIQWSEPYPAYNPLYPYNNAIETESGHAIELDDTPRNERISINHRSGSYSEWYPSGTKVEKITKSNYQIVMSDDHLHVMGKVMITVDSDALIKVLGDVKLEVGNNLEANVSGKMNLSVGEALNIKADSINFDIKNDAALITGGAQYLTATGDINSSAGGSQKITGSSDVNLNAGGSVNAQVGGTVNLNASAPAADKATATGISSPSGRSKKNNAKVSAEPVPTPLPGVVVEFDPETGLVNKQNRFLTQNPDGTLSENAFAPTLVCNFDASTRTFISDPQSWGLSMNGANMIKRFESFAKQIDSDTATAYPDPATGGEPITIGYGSTAPAIDRPIKIGDKVSKSQAEIDLQYAINKKFLPTLRQSVTVGLTQEMVDACLSLMYNIGTGNFARSTLVRKINAQEWCAAGDQFMIWNRANGTVLPGLTSRRATERSLFLT